MSATMLAKTIVLDFETYFDGQYNLTKMTYAEFVHDARFYVHGVAIRHPEGKYEFAWDAAAALAALQQQYGAKLEAVTVIGHNLHFDGYVLAQRFNLIPRYTLDTLQLSHAIFGRKGEGGMGASLGALAERLGLPAKGDISSLSGVRNLSPQQRIHLERYAINDVRNTFEVVEKLLPELSRPGIELRVMAHTLQLHNARGFPVDVDAIQSLIDDIKADTATWFMKTGITAEQASTKAEFTVLLEEALGRTGRKVPFKQGKKAMIPATAKGDAAMQALVDDGDAVVSALARARLAQGSETQLVARLETLKRITAATGGMLPVHLVYHGASTGRFAGGGKFNMQNLPKEGLGKRIRQLFVPLPDHKLVVIDLSQIEARITAALAGEMTLLKAFRDGIDIYCVEAAAVFGRDVRKPRKDDPPELAKLMDGMRSTGKNEVLGIREIIT